MTRKIIKIIIALLLSIRLFRLIFLSNTEQAGDIKEDTPGSSQTKVTNQTGGLLVTGSSLTDKSIDNEQNNIVKQTPTQPTVCHGNTCVNIRIADSDQTKSQGLMFVETMPEDQGMLFIFEQEGNYPFWMMNTLIPLDMIRLDKNGTIQEIQTAEPCKENPCPTYGGTTPSLYVLEINAGLATQRGRAIGDTLTIQR